MGLSWCVSVCKQLLVSYRSQLHRACYITRVDKDNIPGLDAIAESFQRRQVGTGWGRTGHGGHTVPCAPPSMKNCGAASCCCLIFPFLPSPG